MRTPTKIQRVDRVQQPVLQERLQVQELWQRGLQHQD